jgi:aminoglycoside 3-N-acetyltransferase
LIFRICATHSAAILKIDITSKEKCKILTQKLVNITTIIRSMERLLKIIANTPTPRTVSSLVHDLKALGVMPGDTLVVHSSLSAIGFVVGDEVAVIQALQQAVTEQGSIVVPTYSSAISDPAIWENPPVPEAWWSTIRDTMPLFDPVYTPTYGLGAIPEAFRKFPGVLRSTHPASSWCAWGRHAAKITQHHSLSYSYGPNTPLGTLYNHSNTKILLLGVDFSSCSALHLSEILSGVVPEQQCGAPGLDDQGNRAWIQYVDLDYGGDDFATIGHDLETQTDNVITGLVGSATCRLVNFRTCVDFATEWMKRNSEVKKQCK